MCSVCDEILVNSVAKELAHIGLFVSVTEIESSAIEAYSRVVTICSSKPLNINLDKSNKSTLYYDVLKNVVSSEIIAKTRLANARNNYEIVSILTLLQGYLDNFTKLVNIERVNAYKLFKHIIDKLPFTVNLNLLVNQGTPKARLCSNCDNCNMQKCLDDELESGCFGEVTINLIYKSMCIGFRVDPGIFGLTEDTVLSSEYVNNGAQIITNISLAAHNEFRKYAKDIFIELHKENLASD